jgi:hypothetical protein
MTSLHYNLQDFIYVIRGDGHKSKRYKHWCKICKKDRGYAYKNKILKESLCHRCKMNQPDVLAKISASSKKLKHTEESKAKTSASLYKRYNSNPLNRKIAINLRGRLSQAIRNNYKSGSAVRDLGCSIEELRIYLESKFYPNPETGEMMSWDNYGRSGWHIDHIRPLCRFDLTNEVQLKEACNFINLQPLWFKDNLEKRHVDGTF